MYWDDQLQILLITGNTYGTFPRKVGLADEDDADDDDNLQCILSGGHIGKAGKQLLPSNCFMAQLIILLDEGSLSFTAPSLVLR